jgi:hypothetical protein
MKFKIEQLALNPVDSPVAAELLDMMGMKEWIHDAASAKGFVYGEPGESVAQLSFNYDSPPLELEVIRYKEGRNWLQAHNEVPPRSVASHIGMHCSNEELDQWRENFAELGIRVAQEVMTTGHTNPGVGDRRWKYVIFDTRDILGIDVKFIVRMY